MAGRYAGMLKLAVGAKLNNVVVGKGLSGYLTPVIRILLK